jgi:cytochrome c
VLLAHGADVNALGQGNYRMIPPLHLAETETHTEVAGLLREAGAAPAPVEPVAALLESADPGRGREVALQCKTCHSLDHDGTGPPFGPELYSVIGRERASVIGFEYYSPAMKRLGGVWSEEALNVFLAHPVAIVPGTTMVTDGIADPRERADLIAYLRTLGD